MGNYIRAYKDFSFEIVLTSGKFKKRRVHILINPNAQVEIDVFTSKEAAINPDGITHLLYLERINADEMTFRKTLKMAEQLNKPIIVNESSGKKLRSEGISVKQLRYLTDDEIVRGLKIIPITFEWMDYEPSGESLKLDPQPDVPLLQKGFENFLNGIGSFLDFLNPLKKDKKEDPIEEAGKPMALLLEYAKSKVFIPLDALACKYVSEISNLHSPTIVILSDFTLAEASLLNLNVRSMLVIDSTHPKDKELYIPQAQNDTSFDIKLASTEEWIEIV